MNAFLYLLAIPVLYSIAYLIIAFHSECAVTDPEKQAEMRGRFK